ncbi:MAG: DUF1616 domain-containing protein [Candidatus Levyibacteriota bacterium]
MQIVITCLSALYILFLPGLVLSFAFFPKREIDGIERFAISFALSIATVPLIVFYANLVGIAITQTSVMLEVLEVIIIGVFIILIRRFRKEKKT